MQISEIGRKTLKHIRSKSDSAFLDYFADNFKDINGAIAGFDGSKVHLRPMDTAKALDQIRFSAFAYDLATLDFPHTGQAKLRAALDGKTSPFGGLNIQVDEGLAKDPKYLAADGSFMAMPAMVAQTDPSVRKFADAVAPLLMRGHLLICAERGLITLEKTDITGRNHWMVHNVDPASPTELWIVEKTKAGDALPLVEEATARKGEVTLFDISFPFLAGIGFHDLARVLEDEQDHVSKARVALKAVVKEASSSGSSLDEVLNDVLRPQLDGLSRRLKGVEQSRALRQQGTVLGTAAVSFVGLLTGGMLQLAAAVGGAGGFGTMLKNEVDAMEKRSAIKEDPLYLMWKLRELKRS